MTNASLDPIKILLVEDNPGDIRLTTEALKDSKISNTLEIVQDGQDALNFVYKREAFTTAETPDLILLDLDIPLVSGREVLSQIKADPRLTHIPIVVLTVSQSEQDVLRSYNMHANAFVNKPIDLKQFMTVIKSIENFWFTIVKYPPV